MSEENYIKACIDVQLGFFLFLFPIVIIILIIMGIWEFLFFLWVQLKVNRQRREIEE